MNLINLIRIISLLDQVEAARAEQDKLNITRTELENELDKTMNLFRVQSDLIEILEQQSKRYNLRFLGVPEAFPDNPLILVQDIIEEQMKIFMDDVIEKAIRLDDDVTPRPILVKFSRWKDKTKILYKRKSLPPSISVEEDLTVFQRKELSALKLFAEEAEKSGKRVRWQGRQLFVDGEVVKVGI